MNARVNGSAHTIKVSRTIFFAPLLVLALHAYSRLALVVFGVLTAMVLFGDSKTPATFIAGLFVSGLLAIVLRRTVARATAAYGKVILKRTDAISF